MFAQIKEPRKKPKSGSGGSAGVQLPLPIAIASDKDPSVQLFSAGLPRVYTALVADKRVFLHDEWQARALFNCGCFGKGEFSRGAPSLNKPAKKSDSEFHECSLNFKSLAPISHEKFQTRRLWARCLEEAPSEADFAGRFLGEFVRTSVVPGSDEPVFCRLEAESSPEPLLRTPNNPFDSVIRKMPDARLDERHLLMYEEAFFLQFGLGCLELFEADGVDNARPLSQRESWQKFVAIDANFPFRYAVYHKLRSKGWVIRNGLKYGADFLAYFQGPEFYHASYAIRVEQGGEEELTQFAALARINETASKELMLCYVLHECSADELASPNCLKAMSVLESIVARWTANDHNQAPSDAGPARPTATATSAGVGSDDD